MTYILLGGFEVDPNLSSRYVGVTNTTTASKYIPKNLHQWQSRLSDPNLLCKSTYF
jgi:hypothetical protein